MIKMKVKLTVFTLPKIHLPRDHLYHPATPTPSHRKKHEHFSVSLSLGTTVITRRNFKNYVMGNVKVAHGLLHTSKIMFSVCKTSNRRVKLG